jgi:hypothetical protein
MSQPKPQPGTAGGVAQSAPPRAGVQPSALNTLGTAPAVAVQNKAGAASLNPQALPPATLSAQPAAIPGNPVRNKTAPVLLNPQPLPPGGMQQAPSSMR